MNAQRPRQVTVAGWLIILGGIAVVATAYEQMAALHSLATRESVEAVLAEPAFQGAGFGVGGILTLLHVLAMVAAGCATASAVLGWHALRGSRSARVLLSVLAVPLLLAGLGGGGVFSTMVAVAALMLWLPPAGEWFAGEPVEGPADPPPTPQAVHPPSGGRAGAPVPEGRPWTPPAGPPMPPPAAWPPPAWPGQPGYRPGCVPAWGPARPRRRPGVVVAAAVLTWVFGALAVLGLGATMAYVLTDRDGLWRSALEQNPDLRTEGITQGAFIAMACVLVVLAIAWSGVTIVIACFVWRGAAWARITLIVLLAVSLGVLVVAAVFDALFLVPAVAATVTIVLLARGGARAWCQPRR